MEYEFHWNLVFQKMPQLLNGAFVTLHLSVLAMLIGVHLSPYVAVLSAFVFVNAGYLTADLVK